MTTGLLFRSLIILTTRYQIAHRELQFEIRDHRLVPEKPAQRFGYTSPRFAGRFIKGNNDDHVVFFFSDPCLEQARHWDPQIYSLVETERVLSDYGICAISSRRILP